MHMLTYGSPMKRQAGLSLIELMIASAIGLILLAGLSLLFVNSSETNRELQKTAQQIENGRYAIDVLSQNARLAGFYGHLHDWGSIATPATTPPDPCETNAAELLKALWFPVQGYAAPTLGTRPDVSATTCGALTSANLQPGSDILVIRRAGTHSYTSTDTVTNGYYLQATALAAQIQVRTSGTGTLGTCGTDPVQHCRADDGTASTLSLGNGVVPLPAAPIRRYHVHVYFVAPCSVGTGAGGVCQAGDDTIPTLKRLELSTSGSFAIVPLVEGVELLKIEYGIDNAPIATNIATNSAGDSSVDSYTPAPAAGDWGAVIAAKIYVLARNTEATRGFTDDKTYLLGSTTVPAKNDNFKRHVFTAAVRLMNTSGRREIPQ